MIRVEHIELYNDSIILSIYCSTVVQPLLLRNAYEESININIVDDLHIMYT